MIRLQNLVKSFYYEFIDLYKQQCRKIYDSVKDILPEQEGVFTLTDGKNIMDISVPLTEMMGNNEQEKGEYIMRVIVSEVYIRIIDKYWQKHLRNIDALKQSVQNAYYEQKDPLLVFKFDSFEIFSTMITMINKEIVAFIFKGQVLKDKDFKNMSINEIAGALLAEVKKTKDAKQKLKTLMN